MIVLAHAVGNDLEPFTGHVDRRAVRQVTARIEVEPHEGVAGLQQRQENRLVHLAAGVGLNIGEFAVEQLLGAFDRQLLGDIHELAAAIVALAWIALGVFVGHDRPLRLKHGAGNDVFGSDQFDLMPLAAEFVADRAEDVRIDIGQRSIEERLEIFRGCRCCCHGGNPCCRGDRRFGAPLTHLPGPRHVRCAKFHGCFAPVLAGQTKKPPREERLFYIAADV